LTDTKQITSLRPKATSADGIAAAIDRGETTLVELRGERAAIEGARRGILMSGSNADIDKHDSRIRSIGLDIERIEAQIEALRSDLSLTRGRERLAHIESLRLETQIATEAFRTFWLGKYTALANEIAAGLALYQPAIQAVRALNQAIEAARGNADVQAAGGVPPYGTSRDLPVAFIGHNAQKSPLLLVCLPSTEPGPPIYWPHRHVLEPVKSGLGHTYF
jgi:hypothetical protein